MRSREVFSRMGSRMHHDSWCFMVVCKNFHGSLPMGIDLSIKTNWYIWSKIIWPISCDLSPNFKNIWKSPIPSGCFWCCVEICEKRHLMGQKSKKNVGKKAAKPWKVVKSWWKNGIENSDLRRSFCPDPLNLNHPKSPQTIRESQGENPFNCENHEKFASEIHWCWRFLGAS